LEFPKSFVNVPLEQTASSVNWFTVRSGSESLFIVFQAHTPQSIWLPVVRESDDTRGTFFDERPSAEGLMPALAEFCGIIETSTTINYPYHAPLRLLTPLLQLKAGIETFSKLITLTGQMDARFHCLLIEKDTRALLLFSY
jgi:hypothetical protein